MNMDRTASKWDAWSALADAPPIIPGWYATLICWDPEEGFFPSANHWDGTDWNGGYKEVIVSRSPQTFKEKTDAMAWAYDHDVET